MTATTYGVDSYSSCFEARQRNRNCYYLSWCSASTDGGVGALAALGYRFLDANGNAVDATQGGSILSSIRRMTI